METALTLYGWKKKSERNSSSPAGPTIKEFYSLFDMNREFLLFYIKLAHSDTIFV